jgi:hypothetical protein
MKRLARRLFLIASANDPIPVSEMVKVANEKIDGGKGKGVRGLDPSNAKSKLKNAANEIRRKRVQEAPPQRIDDSAIDDWVEKYARKPKKGKKDEV